MKRAVSSFLPCSGYRCDFFLGLRKPRIKILGQELAGEVVSVGQEVTEFKPGDRVLAATMMRFGSYAEFACLPASYPLVIIPDTLSFEKATTIPTGGMNGLHFIQHADVKAGEHVLINGAGGSIGTYALQIAKRLGATVTCVDSGPKLEMLQALGADNVIDYTQEDFTQKDFTQRISRRRISRRRISQREAMM